MNSRANGVDSSSLHIDGFGPIPIRRPDTVAELGEAVRRAREQRQAIYPLGGRTHLGLGVPPTKAGVALETVKLNHVIDYPSRDLTITVQAGIRVSELQSILAKEGQRLAVDVPNAAQATLGGILAINASGPRRIGRGTLRDYLIGVNFVNDDGIEIKSGGRVVKNVAGYDMCKLLVGSLGTLGIITQATLKLTPIAEANGLVLINVALEKIDALLDLVQRSQTRPCCVELLNPAAVEACGLPGIPNLWLLAVAFEDNEPAVQWQVRTLQAELRSDSGTTFSQIEGHGILQALQKLAEFSVRQFSVFRMRASVSPQTVGGMAALVTARQEPWQVQAHAGNGIVLIQANADVGKDSAHELMKAVLKFATEQGGNVVVEDCPSAWKAGVPIWGAPRDDNWLMHSIKKNLDPDNIFNPGRFVSGI